MRAVTYLLAIAALMALAYLSYSGDHSILAVSPMLGTVLFGAGRMTSVTSTPKRKRRTTFNPVLVRNTSAAGLQPLQEPRITGMRSSYDAHEALRARAVSSLRSSIN